MLAVVAMLFPLHGPRAEEVAPARELNCRVIPADCPKEVAATDAMILADPDLAALRAAMDREIDRLKSQPDLSENAKRMFDEDEARFRKSLRRELFFGRGQEDVNKASLEQTMTRRLEQLQRLSLRTDDILGDWANANGTIIVVPLDEESFLIFANPYDIFDLRWTCELSGRAFPTDYGLMADLGEGETIELRLVDGQLHTDHKSAPPSQFCGAGGHASGIWFREAARMRSAAPIWLAAFCIGLIGSAIADDEGHAAWMDRIGPDEDGFSISSPGATHYLALITRLSAGQLSPEEVHRALSIELSNCQWSYSVAPADAMLDALQSECATVRHWFADLELIAAHGQRLRIDAYWRDQSARAGVLPAQSIRSWARLHVEAGSLLDLLYQPQHWHEIEERLAALGVRLSPPDADGNLVILAAPSMALPAPRP